MLRRGAVGLMVRRVSYCPNPLCLRLMSSVHHRRKNAKDSPFKILGVSEESSFKRAKKAFLEIALKNHPDTAVVDDEKEKNKMREVFIRARRAFESLTEGPDGSILLKEEAEEMGDFDEWFRQETGRDNPFQFDMDPQTMKEVAEMTDSTGGVGLDRDGGMWTLANMVTNAVKSGGDGGSILRLEAGETNSNHANNDHINGVLRRKRRHSR